MSPYDLLQIDPPADDATIRQAYLAAIQRHPPTEDSEAFDRIARAYDLIATEEKRLQYDLFGLPEAVPGGPLAQVLDYVRTRRPRPDYAALRATLKQS